MRTRGPAVRPPGGPVDRGCGRRGIGRQLTELGARALGYDRLFGLLLPEVDCPLTITDITDDDLIAALTGRR